MTDPSRVSASTIVELLVRPVLVPMSTPHTTASGVITESPLILIDVRTSEGASGHGLLFTYTRMAQESITTFLRELSGLVVGRALEPETLTDELTSRFRLLGTQGFVGMALAGIDMALWDALARTNEVSLVSLLGGNEKPIPAYGAVGFDGVAGCVRQAEGWVNLGFTAVKAKIGYPTVEEDVAVIEAMQDAVGADVQVMVDYNQSLSSTEAIERVQVLDSLGLAWVEEPTLAHDFSGHATVTQAAQTPIQCGENWWNTLDVKHGIETRASNLVMLDVMKVGGVTGWVRAAALAEKADVAVSSHLWPELSARLLSCSGTAHWLEYCDWWHPILREPLQVQRGSASFDDVAGSGVDWNEKAVEGFLV